MQLCTLQDLPQEAKMVEKRKFGRIPFGTDVFVTVKGVEYSGALTDLSLKGASVRFVTSPPQQAALPWTLTIPLGGSGEIALTFSVETAHVNDDIMGFHFVETDLDTATHLRRLLELNTGDPEQIERELCLSK